MAIVGIIALISWSFTLALDINLRRDLNLLSEYELNELDQYEEISDKLWGTLPRYLKADATRLAYLFIISCVLTVISIFVAFFA